MRMNTDTRRKLFLEASRLLCDVATLLERAAEPDSDVEPEDQRPGYSIEVLDAEERLFQISDWQYYPGDRQQILDILNSVYRAGREEASEELFSRGYAAGRCEREAVTRAPGEATIAELVRQKEAAARQQADERKQSAAQKLSDLVVTRNGVPLEDQVAGIAEFKERCLKSADLRETQRATLGTTDSARDILDREYVGEQHAKNTSRAAADLAGANVRPMNPAFRYRGEYRDRATSEYPGD